MNTIAVTKSAFVRARIEPNLKRHAEQILSAVGISTTDAIHSFYKQIIFNKGIPFSLNIPNKETISSLNEDPSLATRYDSTDEMFDAILGKNWRDK